MHNTHELGVIFDVDGVLVDSYEAHWHAFQTLATELGVTYTKDDFADGFGRTSRDILRTWFDPEMTDEDVARHDAAKEAHFRSIIAEDFPAMPGARSLIAQLHESGFSLAMGSSGPPENVQLANNMLGCSEAFSALVTGMDVTHGKPDPEVFLVAAKRIGIDPSNCCVVEDARAGIQAANAAGMASIGLVSRGHTGSELGQADLVVDALDELSSKSIANLIRSMPPK